MKQLHVNRLPEYKEIENAKSCDLYIDGSCYYRDGDLMSVGYNGYFRFNENPDIKFIGAQLFMGFEGNNHVHAEYFALITGALMVSSVGYIGEINIFGDNEQVMNLKDYFFIDGNNLKDKILEVLSLFKKYSLNIISRKDNKLADRLSRAVYKDNLNWKYHEDFDDEYCWSIVPMELKQMLSNDYSDSVINKYDYLEVLLWMKLMK